MKELKVNPTNIEQVWHDVNFGDGLPKENGIYLIITNNRDYAVAYFAFKGEVLDKDMNWVGDKLPDISTALIANEDGFYTVSPFDGKRRDIKKYHATAWTLLTNPGELLNQMVRGNK